MEMISLGDPLREEFNDRVYERVVTAPCERLEEGLDWRLRDRLCWRLNSRLNAKVADRLADRLMDVFP